MSTTATSSAIGQHAAGPDYVAQLLREQQDLSAVERFAQKHASATRPLLETHYRDLLPIAGPGPGEQYAFEVDLDACTGCKACVTACHSLNGLDDFETWRSVGLLQGGTVAVPMLQHVTTACHHCLEPACMIGCPVNAYEKDPQTGIVKHLDDQCIGCQYCTLTCPYDVPQYHPEKGIVRKCDMCSDRLAADEAPACVQSCPNSAIRIRVVSQREVIQNSEANIFLPGAPGPRMTLPTTSYLTGRPLLTNMLPADYYRAVPQHGHLALVVMLVLTQLSVGAYIVTALWEVLGPGLPNGQVRALFASTALGLGVLGMAAAIFHLGRPLYAFRSLLGLKTSWLSREILAFNLFAAFALAFAVAAFVDSRTIGERSAVAALLPALRWLTIATGIAGVFCSACIYAVTGRVLWQLLPTCFRFAATTAIMGLAATMVLGALADALFRTSLARGIFSQLIPWLVGCSLAKVASELLLLRHLMDRQLSPAKRTARLLTGDLALPAVRRIFFLAIGGIVLPLLLIAQQAPLADPVTFYLVVSLLILICTAAAEFTERYLFFAAVVAPKMPGGISR